MGDRARRGPTVEGPICMEVSARMCNCVYTMYYTYCWHDWFLRRGDWRRVRVGRTSVRRRRVLGSWSVGGADLASSLYGEVGRGAAPEKKSTKMQCII